MLRFTRSMIAPPRRPPVAAAAAAAAADAAAGAGADAGADADGPAAAAATMPEAPAAAASGAATGPAASAASAADTPGAGAPIDRLIGPRLLCGALHSVRSELQRLGQRLDELPPLERAAFETGDRQKLQQLWAERDSIEAALPRLQQQERALLGRLQEALQPALDRWQAEVQTTIDALRRRREAAINKLERGLLTLSEAVDALEALPHAVALAQRQAAEALDAIRQVGDGLHAPVQVPASVDWRVVEAPVLTDLESQQWRQRLVELQQRLERLGRSAAAGGAQ